MDSITSYKKDVEDENLVLTSEFDADAILSYYTRSISTDNAFKQIIKAVERLVRMSRSYTAFVGTMKSDLSMNICTFFEQVDDSIATIELHHYPFTLYDIVEIVIVSKILKKELFSTLTVARTVMHLHKLLYVGVVPLSRTVHELVHSGKIFIPLDAVTGNWEQFMQNYKHAMSTAQLEKIEKIKSANADYISKGELNLPILDFKPYNVQEYMSLLSNKKNLSNIE